MKANEAPEKLYVNFHFIETHPESHQPLVTKQGINKYDIEYTRTDIFIDKVYSWLKNYAYVDDDGCTYWPTLLHDFLKDSRNF